MALSTTTPLAAVTDRIANEAKDEAVMWRATGSGAIDGAPGIAPCALGGT